MINNSKFIKWDIIPVLICIFLCSSQLKVLLPFINPLVVMGIGFIYTFWSYKNFYYSRNIFWLLIYDFVLVLNYLGGDYYFQRIPNIAEEILLLLVPAAICYYIIAKQKLTMAKSIVISIFVLIIYSTIATFIVDLNYPDAVRTSVYWSNREESEMLYNYYAMGMVMYRFPHALPILIPPLIFILKNRHETGSFKLFAAATLIAVFFVMYLSNAATPLFVALLILVLSILVTETNIKKNVVRALVILLIFIPFISSTNVFVDFLDYLGYLIGGDTKVFSDRFEDLQAFSSQNNTSGDLGERANKYSISFSLFTENILLGSNKPTGEHSTILDRIASLGIVGWIPYIIYIFKTASGIGKMLSKRVIAYYYLGVLAALLILGSKNMSYWDIWFMFFCMLPITLWVSIKKE